MANVMDFVNLLGYSIKHEELANLIKMLAMQKYKEDWLDVKNNILESEYRTPDNNFSISFRGYKRYAQEYGEPFFIENKSDDELILLEINILENDGTSFVDESLGLPFDLKIGDDKDTIIAKLNKKPSEKVKINQDNYKEAWWFNFSDYKILTALNLDYKLIWMRIILIDIYEKKRIELKKTLSQQNKYIKPENKVSILSYNEKLFKKEWERRMEDGDEMYTQESIDAVDTLLKNFIVDLAEYTEKKKASNIYNRTKKLVLALNKINVKYDNLIETIEREELCDFINNILTETGLFSDSTIDITEEWREW